VDQRHGWFDGVGFAIVAWRGRAADLSQITPGTLVCRWESAGVFNFLAFHRGITTAIKVLRIVAVHVLPTNPKSAMAATTAGVVLFAKPLPRCY